MTKKIYFGTNLKMYKGNAEAVDYLTKLSELADTLPADKNLELFVIPSFTTLSDAIAAVRSIPSKHPIMIGAQNMNPNDSGQFTGDISPLMLKELGVQLVMIGHSERRHVFRETDQEENAKVLAALKHQFVTLLCVGETLEQKNYGISDEILRTQLKIGLHGVTPDQLSLLRVAYEPVWAIGTAGIPASAGYADEKQAVIKQCLIELFGEEGDKIPVFYGGSVNPENAPELFVQPHIDGLFIGRSAWEVDKFHALMSGLLTK
ncbi:Triose-phosphate isomerase [Actinobacillus succinogenes 130Z]|uniref:Triosephosphate isomerase n=1 Tax=Actinobacillus succinogenes (strain ATCC 55618 / DSM 22257 / CCUG 43843 / 130Z) TaxID=339671 RepID=A6VPQ8_ACTSZ|nr:Triose-phosphate isomerase [Actinobacillus succinogenes 130Z]